MGADGKALKKVIWRGRGTISNAVNWEVRILVSGLSNKVELENPGHLAGFGRKMLNSVFCCWAWSVLSSRWTPAVQQVWSSAAGVWSHHPWNWLRFPRKNILNEQEKFSQSRGPCVRFLFGNTKSQSILKIPDSENEITYEKQSGHSSTLIIHLPVNVSSWLYPSLLQCFLLRLNWCTLLCKFQVCNRVSHSF